MKTTKLRETGDIKNTKRKYIIAQILDPFEDFIGRNEISSNVSYKKTIEVIQGSCSEDDEQRKGALKEIESLSKGTSMKLEFGNGYVDITRTK